MTEAADEVSVLAEQLVAAAAEQGATLAVAESLTGGAVASAIVGVPGASAVLRLGVVAYATPMKQRVLGVDAELLRLRGAVDADVAEQMAAGVRLLAGGEHAPATLGLATTGVAGPDAQDGHDPGEVFIAVATQRGTRSQRFLLHGDRAEVREGAVRAALRLGIAILRESTGAAGDSQE